MKKLEVVIVGAGQRGRGYARYAIEHPDKVVIKAIAEPHDFYRNALAKEHNITSARLFRDWKEVAARSKFADAVVIATQDKMHTEPAIAFSNLGYDILLEKPMAPSESECNQIVETVKKNHTLLAVSHVLRYAPYTQKLKKIIHSGRIGDVISIQRLEPVGYWHHAHSYVRGNWRKELNSTFMLMAKSCHDLDWIRYFAEASCKKISSFGNLKHFKKENKPDGASDRCVNCKVESNCPYSAKKIYLGMYKSGHIDWPVSYITTDISTSGIEQALRNGDYGKCVYECDNDVVDHQVVNMEFANAVTASFTMTAFTPFGDRKTTIFGTRGQISYDGSKMQIYDFLTDKTETLKSDSLPSGIFSGHNGGDNGLMQHFVDAAITRDADKILSGPDETLETHLMVFAAEKSRRTGQVVYL
ncbi:MAG: oxidoreductase [Planctomycetes bacterium GWF2_41_51]|nr:MAG: oxidoreductase [Planctomycetes bacterium GWF2_41_51]HBG28024.1 oxidoreductase [Phycisphaerales bacterium]